MKSMVKILSRYVLSAAGIALILLVLNLLLLALWTIQSADMANPNREYGFAFLADSLTKSNGAYVLSEEAVGEIDRLYQWAMLIDDRGDVVWNRNLPQDVPRHYTVADVASFSRWYLKDYPVYVWQHEDGLFVLGVPKGSLWKYNFWVPQNVLENTLLWIPPILILNGVAAVLLAVLLGMRLFRSLQRVAEGIDALAENRPACLPAKGLMKDLAEGINRASERLQTQGRALSRRDSARTGWIASVSHDIRTPLSLIMGHASELEEQAALPAETREKAGVIRRQSERIRTLISDLNLASKLTYAMQPLDWKRFSMAALARRVAADFLNCGLEEKYRISLSIEREAQHLFIAGDERLLTRAVSNLVSNSLRHNPEGCTVTLSLLHNGSNLLLRVADDGKGFPESVLNTPADWENFEELPAHGLGLLIVRQIVRTHRGTLRLYNPPEGGSLSEICLPCSDS